VTFKFKSHCQEYLLLRRDIQEGGAGGGVGEGGQGEGGQGTPVAGTGGGGREGQIGQMAAAVNGLMPDVIVDLSGSVDPRSETLDPRP